MNRRAFLSGAVGGFTAVAGCGTRQRLSNSPGDGLWSEGGSHESGPSRSKGGETFSTVLNVVDDLGCAPDGSRPCDDTIRNNIGDDTLFSFPTGRYRFADAINVRDKARIGFRGDEDVRFVPPSGFGGRLLDIADVGKVVFRGIDFDISAKNTTCSLRIITRDGFRIEDVTYHGRGTHPTEEVPFAFYLAATGRRSLGVLRNAVATRGSAVDRYKSGKGRGAVWIGENHRGTIRIEDCRFEEFGNNALYCSRTPGNVQVQGGFYRNNNVSAVRISGRGSYVDGARIVADFDAYFGPQPGTESTFRTRGVVVERGSQTPPPGVVVRNCDIYISKSPSPGPGVSVWPTGQTVKIENTRIRVDEPVPAVHREAAIEQGENDHPPSTGERWVHLDEVSIVGNAKQTPIVLVLDGSRSTIRRSVIKHRKGDREGIAFLRSRNVTIAGGRVETSGPPIIISRSHRRESTDAESADSTNGSTNENENHRDTVYDVPNEPCVLLVRESPTLSTQISQAGTGTSRRYPMKACVPTLIHKAVPFLNHLYPPLYCIRRDVFHQFDHDMPGIAILDLQDDWATVSPTDSLPEWR